MHFNDAEGIYANRGFDRLPILADAPLDTGYDHEELMYPAAVRDHMCGDVEPSI